ncbi:MAG: hypothetical protein MH472_14050 [Bacteroidia bacterium]|nr:hypothetical protein [Bacteroidia bacterium]
MKTSKLMLLLAVLLIFVNEACREKAPCQDPRNKECENYDPCIDAKETSAVFTIEELVRPQANDDLMPRNHFIRYETDTVQRWNDIVFTCTQKADSIWWIFEETEMRPEWQQKQSFSIKFGSPSSPQMHPERVKITCIVKNNKPNPCFPGDNGIDTFTRYIVYMPVFQTGFVGTYKGSLTSKPDSVFNLTLRFDSIEVNQGIKIIYVAFDEILSEPAYESPIWEKGFEYTRNWSGGADCGYYATYLFFNSLSGQQSVSPSYKGKTIKGIAIYNAATNSLQIDFIRHGTNIYGVSEWPPKNIPLLTFIGKKVK